MGLAAGNGCLIVSPVRGGGRDFSRNAKSASSLGSMFRGGRRRRIACVCVSDRRVAGATLFTVRASGWSGAWLRRKRSPFGLSVSSSVSEDENHDESHDGSQEVSFELSVVNDWRFRDWRSWILVSAAGPVLLDKT